VFGIGLNSVAEEGQQCRREAEHKDDENDDNDGAHILQLPRAHRCEPKKPALISRGTDAEQKPSCGDLLGHAAAGAWMPKGLVWSRRLAGLVASRSASVSVYQSAAIRNSRFPVRLAGVD
jgi:hypothetical protein